jgi:hypothetical protein
MMIAHLIDVPSTFARIVIDRSTYVDFDHIIRCIVPSFFGFFASDEHLLYAISFYSEIITLASPPQTVSILEPLFNSAPTVRFLEVALDLFFTPFLLECSISATHDLEPLAASHGSFLVDCFTRAAPLLPAGHKTLLRLLRDNAFPRRYFRELVLKRFLWAATFARLRASACAQEFRYLQAVVLSAGGQKHVLNRLFQELLDCPASFHTPMLFGAFNETFLGYYLCVNDVCLLARLLDQARQLPSGLTLSDFLDVDAAFQYRLFWCQVFPRTALPVQMVALRLVFPAKMNDLRTPFPELLRLANSFEMLMEETRKATEARDWKKLLSAHVELLMIGGIGWLAGRREMSVPKRIQQKIEIAAIGDGIARDPEVRDLSARWDALVGQGSEKLLPAGVSSRVWPALRLARSAGCAQLADAFPMLLDAMRQFRIVAERAGGGGEMVIAALLRMLPGDAVLVPFLIINATVAHGPEFMSDSERRCWVTLERCFLAVLCGDVILLRDVIAKQTEIMQLGRIVERRSNSTSTA